MSACLMAGAVAVALATDGRFSLEWTHSVERMAWREEWQVSAAGLSLTRAAVKGSGAGMEPGEGGHFEGDWWVWEPHAPPVPRLVLAASGETLSGWRLCGRDCIALGNVAGAPVVLQPCGG